MAEVGEDGTPNTYTVEAWAADSPPPEVVEPDAPWGDDDEDGTDGE